MKSTFSSIPSSLLFGANIILSSPLMIAASVDLKCPVSAVTLFPGELGAYHGGLWELITSPGSPRFPSVILLL